MPHKGEDYVPVFKYRGALNKDQILTVDLDAEEEEDFDPDSILGKKRTNKRSASSFSSQTQKKKKTSSSSKSNQNRSLSVPQVSTSSTVFTIDDEDDEEPIQSSTNKTNERTGNTINLEEELPVVTATERVISAYPQLQVALQKVRAAKEVATELRTSSSSSSSISKNNSYGIYSNAIGSYTASNSSDNGTTVILIVRNRSENNSTVKFRMYKNDKLQKLLDNYIKTKNISNNKNKNNNNNKYIIKYDGLPIDIDKSPYDYDMQDNDIIDISINKIDNIKDNIVVDDDNNKNKNKNVNTIDDDNDDNDDDDDDLIVTSVSNSKNDKSNKSLSSSSSSTITTTTTTSKSTTATTTTEQDDDTGTPIGDTVKLKVRLPGKSEAMKFKVGKETNFKKLFESCCEQTGYKIDNIKFMFDGSILSINDTPSDHDMEDGDLIDIIIK